MALEDVSKFALVSVVLSTVAFLEHIIGFGAPFWKSSGNSHSGLWKNCVNDYQCTALVGIPKTAGLKRASQNIGSLEHLDIPGIPDLSDSLGGLPPHLRSADGAMEAAQAFETLAFLLLFATLVMLGLRFTIKKENKLLPKLTIGSQFGAVAFILIGVIIYAAEIKNKTETYGYAFAFVTESLIISFVAGVFNFLDYKYSSDAAPK